MSRIHGLAKKRMAEDLDLRHDEYECFCGRVFYSEKEFRDHVNNYG